MGRDGLLHFEHDSTVALILTLHSWRQAFTDIIDNN